MNFKEYLKEGLGSAWQGTGGPKQKPTLGAKPKPKTDAFTPYPHDDIVGHINGAIGSLEDIKKMAEYGNMKSALQSYKHLMKNLKTMENFLK